MAIPNTVLVVEDDPEIGSMLSKSFSILGYNVTHASDGHQALEQIEAGYFDVVLLDIMLPGPNGMEILKQIRKQRPKTEVIMLTAYASLDTAVDALRLGAYDYVTKPFKFDTIRSAVRRAVEKQRLEANLAAIYDLSREMTLSLSVNQVIWVVADTVEQVLELGTCAIGLIDDERDELYLLSPHGVEQEAGDRELNELHRLSLSGDEGVTVAVVHSGELLYAPDVQEEPRYVKVRATTRSELAVPLKVKERVIGVLDVESPDVNAFSKADVRLFSALAAQAAVAIENARLHEQARQEIAERRRAEEGQRRALAKVLQATRALRESEKAERAAREQAETLRQATTALASTLDLNVILNSILTYLEQVVPYASASVFLYEQRKKRLRVVAAKGFPFLDQVIGRDFPADNAIWLELDRTRQPLILPDARADHRFEKWGSVDIADIRGWMGVPLIAQGELVGYLTFDSRQVGAYSEKEAALAQAFVNQAAAAIQNARLFKQVRAGRERLQALSRRHVEAQEAERGRIARELHDETGQALSAMLLGLSLFAREVDRPDAIIARASEMEKMVDEMLENLHRLAINLRPASLDLLGLVPALGQYIETFGEQHNITPQFETLIGLGGERLPPAVETAIYRIVQEALTNVARHAQATYVDVLLERRGDQIVTIVEDDGIGFNVEEAMQGSRLGLFGMRERAEMLGGVMTIESTIGAGTTVIVEIPYDISNART